MWGARIAVHTLVIGYDHRFGHNRSENFEDYCRYGEELNIYIVRARAYTDKEGKIIVEDVKSPRTRKNPEYIIKRKLMLERYGITIKEVA